MRRGHNDPCLFSEEMNMKEMTAKQKYGLLISLVILVVMFFVPAPEGLTVAGVRTLGCTLSMLVLLSTGALPLGLTALIFMVL